MPIFKGTWLDDEGVGFDADSFVLHTTGGVTIIDVAGDPDPDCTGHYNYIGEIGGKPYYTRDPPGFSIWWWALYEFWTLSLAPGQYMPGFWQRPDPVEGTYEPELAATGNPIAAFRRGGIARARIHGLRHASGAKPGYYPATVDTPAGFYDFSPRQRHARQTFGQVQRAYRWLPPLNQIWVLGDVVPVIAHGFGPLDFHNGEQHWFGAPTQYHLWYENGLDVWYMADTFPDLPGGGDPNWTRPGVDPYGDFQPFSGAVGVATVTGPYLAAVVTTSKPSIKVGGNPFPAIKGTYYPFVIPFQPEYWHNSQTGYYLWFSNAADLWLLATSYPDLPDYGVDPFWWRVWPWRGSYTALWPAQGKPTVWALTYNGKYYFHGLANEHDHLFSSHRNAHLWFSVANDSFILAQTFPDDPTMDDTWWKSETGDLLATYLPQDFTFGEVTVEAPP